MNETKIEYCDRTWNPVTGCRHNCDFCYARKIAKRYGLYGGSFDPQFHPDKLDEPYKEKKPMVIFVCDMGDIFSPGMKGIWIEQVKLAAMRAPWHTYLWLTKNPQYDETWVRGNWWLGASITGPSDAYRREILSEGNHWYSYEPLFGVPEVEYLWDAKQVIIGRATRYKAGWCNEWAIQITDHYQDRVIPVFWKDNIRMIGPKELAWATNK